MASAETLTPKQLKLARTALWHQNGDALRTADDTRKWLETAGLVPYYPHAQFAAAPQGSFAEAVLGRPEQGWMPTVPSAANAAAPDDADTADGLEDKDDLEDEESDEDQFEDEESDENAEEDSDDSEDQDDSDDEGEDSDDDEDDSDEDETNEDAVAVSSDAVEASDPEVMLSNDDEFAEDEGDEIAEVDRIHAGDDPLPNDLDEGTTSTEGAEEDTPAEEDAAPAPEPINGFSPEERETVQRTLARMVEEGSAVPLNLLGSNNGEPDYICSAQAFSFIYTLRGDKTWKQEPAQTGSMRVSPLAVKVYALLKDKGAQAPHELTAELGQGIVDSAVLRALSELWAIQRVIPVPDANGEPAKWELLTGRFIRHVKAGSNAGQPTALSALLSLYLSQAVAASSDEMEIFLSPLAARSRVREVVGALSASRQLESTVLEGKALLYLPGALETLPAADKAPAAHVGQQRSRYEDDDRRAMQEERAARFAADGGAERAGQPANFPVRRPAGARDAQRGGRPGGFGGGRPDGSPRPGGFRGDRPGGPPRREGGFAPSRRSAGGFGAPRENGFGGSGADRERRPFVRRDNDAPRGEGASEQARGEFARPWDEERRPSAPREGGERRPFTPRGDGERRPFTPREGGGERRPFTPRGDRPFASREGGERRPFTPREGGGERRPFTPREGGGERRPFTPRGDGERRPFTPREGGGDRRPFAPREGGERRPFTPRADGERRPFTPRGDGERRPFTPREGGGERRPFVPREGGERRPFTPRDGGGERRPFTPRDGGERRPFTPREGGERRPFTPREGGRERRPFTPRGDGERRPFTPREGGGERRPFTPRAEGERRPFVPREGGGRPAFGSGGRPSGAGGAKFGGSGFGRDRNGGGGFSKPGFSPARRGPGSGPGRGGAPKRRPE